jgi:ribonucleoside-triphosphate reductase
VWDSPVQKHHVDRLPKISPRLKQAKSHTIADSIEGWATALDVLLSSYFENGGKHPEYGGRKIYFDPSQVRPKGSFISGGFKAPGPEPLIGALNKIENILNKVASEGRSLKPIEAYDILMHASDSVIAGGVRRSATIALFSPDDEEMMDAKTGDWFVTNPQRARSNNSAILVRKDTTREQFDRLYSRVKEFGEPGFLFVEDKDHATNPCVEIGFRPQWFLENGEAISGWQACNLVEINGGACTTEEAFYEACNAAAIMGTLQAGYTNFKFLGEYSQKIIEREALLGVSVTGVDEQSRRSFASRRS